MEPIPTNTAIFSGRGFRPYVRDPGAVMDVAAGSVWGADEVDRLRQASWVRVLPPAEARDAPQQPPSERPVNREAASERPYGGALAPEDLVLRTVLWLALAGVPVSTEGVAPAVRHRLDPDLLALLDRVDPAAVADPGERELLSLALRRRARLLLGHHFDHLPRTVVVLLPDGELPAALAADLAAQTWTEVVRCQTSGEDAAQAVASAYHEGALYCTRMGAGLRYGPHHLADLIEALRYSGARVAHSPLRFRPWRGGAWLEDAAVEGSAAGGMTDGSLWYAVDGPAAPASAEGYAVHGAGAVPVSDVDGGPPTPLRLHPGTPTVLNWVGPVAGDGELRPPSYFATAGASVPEKRLRSQLSLRARSGRPGSETAPAASAGRSRSGADRNP